jgi:photosystem II stability/assembly factor-like uncharacterized protein
MKTNLKIFLSAVMIFLISGTNNAQWVPQTSPATQHLSGILHFPSLPISIIVGTGATILKTTNNGINWLSITSPANNSLSGITNSGSNTAWICGNGLVLKSTNGGTNWTSLTVPNRFWSSIHMLNDNTGWVCGSTDSVIKTTNGGINWTVQENNVFANETNASIQFVNATQGYMCGYTSINNGYILRTINGGANWNAVLLTTEPVQSIQMINSNTGYAGGNGKIYKTTNSGTNWVASSNISGVGGIFSLHFPLSADIGYAVSTGGKIIKTTNGGTNWLVMTSPTSSTLKGIKFKSASNDVGAITGNSGTILWTTNGGGSFTAIQPVQSEIPESFSLSQNYPNPFNPVTNIKFSIPTGEFVSLKIYDVTGREAAGLVNEQLSAGTYKIDFDAAQLSSGTYFYRISAGSFTEVKKMTLIK